MTRYLSAFTLALMIGCTANLPNEQSNSRENGNEAVAALQPDEDAILRKKAPSKPKVVLDEKLPGKPVVAYNSMAGDETDADMRDFTAFKNLQSLDIVNAPVTDAGLKELKACKNLQSLNLSRTKVTDAGMKSVRELKSLRTLDLSHTRITDTGLKEIKECNTLRTLDISHTRVSETGVDDLQQALPNLKIRAEMYKTSR